MTYLQRNEEECIGCGFCEATLPGLHTALQYGPLMLSEMNSITRMDIINETVEGCLVDALELVRDE